MLFEMCKGKGYLYAYKIRKGYKNVGHLNAHIKVADIVSCLLIKLERWQELEIIK